jgi:hypothetical protein
MVLRNARHFSLISASFGGYWPPKGTPARGLRPRHHVGPHFVAIPGRLELPTYGLGNRRSIRLSYGTANPTLISEEAGDRQSLERLVERHVPVLRGASAFPCRIAASCR